jgi:periplasmic protein TonB
MAAATDQGRRVTTAPLLAAVTLACLLAACSAPAPAPAGPAAPAATPVPAPAGASPAPVEPATPASPRAPAARLAPRDPALETWKRDAALRIHQANRKHLFEGRPHHLLKAVIVVEVTVDASGQVVGSKVLRSPKIKSLDDMALTSLKAASPLPAPPKSLLARGRLVYSETWLVQNDGRFQVRTLAQPQE